MTAPFDVPPPPVEDADVPVPGRLHWDADFSDALDLLARHPRCHLDTTGRHLVHRGRSPAAPDWAARLADVADRVVFGSNIPYSYAEQVRADASWAAADDRLGAPFLRSVLHDAPDRLLGRPG